MDRPTVPSGLASRQRRRLLGGRRRGEERLIVVQEIERLTDFLDFQELVGLVRQAIAAHHDLMADTIFLVKAGPFQKPRAGRFSGRHAVTHSIPMS